MSRLTALAACGMTIAALALPATGQANKGGHPHTTAPCPTHRHHGRHNGAGHGKKNGSTRGRKCSAA